ncbi:MAG: toll/interleukin-1 receptor domain-containing protein, partial [Chloroflexi bacterium]
MATSDKITLFISYARDDDKDFVQRLYHDLTEQGIDAWWDKEDIRNQGQTFLQVIQEQVFQRDVLILIVGPEAAQSEYVRYEWQHALTYGKLIYPVLRKGDYTLVPPELKNYHCYDFSTESSYRTDLPKLLDDIRDSIGKSGALVNVPAYPNHYLRRADVDQVKNSLLEDVTTTVIASARTMALHGMGGIGKTVVAIGVARDMQIRRSFTDGIIWLTIGQKPDMLQKLNALAKRLGHGGDYRNIDDATSALQARLAEMRALLILDDVWQPDHAEPFRNLIAETRNRLLITTRRKSIHDELGGQLHRVDLLPIADAVTLLNDWAGKQDPDAAAVVKRVNRLPLAVKIAGARLARGMSGAEWLT